MSGKKKVGASLLDGIPEPPAAYQPGELRDTAGPVQRGLAELRADGADTSGADKAFRLMRSLAWGAAVVGGSVHSWRRTRAARGAFRDATQARVSDFPKDHRGMNQSLATIQTAAREVERRTEQIEAAEQWDGVDNVVLKERIEGPETNHAYITNQISRHRQVGIPCPAELEESLIEVENELVSAKVELKAGEERFSALHTTLATATEKGRRALSGSLGNLAARLGGECRQLVADSNISSELLLRFPHRAPNELLALHRRADRINTIMSELVQEHDMGMRRFWNACEGAAEVVRKKVNAGHPTTVRRGRGPEDGPLAAAL